MTKQDVINDFNERLERAISFVVTGPSSDNYIQDVKYILEPMSDFMYDIYVNNKIDFNILDTIPFQNQVEERSQERFGNELSETDERILTIGSIARALLIDYFKSNIPDDYKAALINSLLEISDDAKFIRQSETPLGGESTEEFLKKKLKKLNKYGKEIGTVKDLFETSKSEYKKYVELHQLWNVSVVEKLDSYLRGTWIKTEDPLLVHVLHDDWANNSNCINWIGDQQSLLTLFYLLTETKREIIGGTITQLISRTFIIQGETKTELQISKAFSKISSIFSKSKSVSKPPTIVAIESIFNKANI